MDSDSVPPHESDQMALWGYRYSVYTRIARMVLHFRDIAYVSHEADPFADPPDPALTRVSPFGRVPVLDHGGFVLSETTAICRYIATGFPGQRLVPAAPHAAARMDQVISAMDAHGYWPMVRQVFSHAVFRPLIGAEANPDTISDGLTRSAPMLRLLNNAAEEQLIMSHRELTLADLHLAPMIGYFDMAPQGQRALRTYPALYRWWGRMKAHPAYLSTDPGLATLTSDA